MAGGHSERRKMKTLCFVLGVSFIGISSSAMAQTAPATANVVSACGTTNGNPYTVGQVRPVTQSTAGKLCNG